MTEKISAKRIQRIEPDKRDKNTCIRIDIDRKKVYFLANDTKERDRWVRELRVWLSIVHKGGILASTDNDNDDLVTEQLCTPPTSERSATPPLDDSMYEEDDDTWSENDRYTSQEASVAQHAAPMGLSLEVRKYEIKIEELMDGQEYGAKEEVKPNFVDGSQIEERTEEHNSQILECTAESEKSEELSTDPESIPLVDMMVQEEIMADLSPSSEALSTAQVDTGEIQESYSHEQETCIDGNESFQQQNLSLPDGTVSESPEYEHLSLTEELGQTEAKNGKEAHQEDVIVHKSESEEYDERISESTTKIFNNGSISTQEEKPNATNKKLKHQKSRDNVEILLSRLETTTFRDTADSETGRSHKEIQTEHQEHVSDNIQTMKSEIENIIQQLQDMRADFVKVQLQNDGNHSTKLRDLNNELDNQQAKIMYNEKLFQRQISEMKLSFISLESQVQQLKTANTDENERAMHLMEQLLLEHTEHIVEKRVRDAVAKMEQSVKEHLMNEIITEAENSIKSMKDKESELRARESIIQAQEIAIEEVKGEWIKRQMTDKSDVIDRFKVSPLFDGYRFSMPNTVDTGSMKSPSQPLSTPLKSSNKYQERLTSSSPSIASDFRKSTPSSLTYNPPRYSWSRRNCEIFSTPKRKISIVHNENNDLASPLQVLAEEYIESLRR